MFTGSTTLPMTGDITITIDTGTRIPELAPFKEGQWAPASVRQLGVSSRFRSGARPEPRLARPWVAGRVLSPAQPRRPSANQNSR